MLFPLSFYILDWRTCDPVLLNPLILPGNTVSDDGRYNSPPANIRAEPESSTEQIKTPVTANRGNFFKIVWSSIFALLSFYNALHEMDRFVCSCPSGGGMFSAMGFYLFTKHNSNRDWIYRNKFWQARLCSFCPKLFLYHFSFHSKALGQAMESADRCIEYCLGR